MLLKGPLCLKGPGWRLGGAKVMLRPLFGRLGGAMARLPPPHASASKSEMGKNAAYCRLRFAKKTPTLESKSRTSVFPSFQTSWLQWCTKKSILVFLRVVHLSWNCWNAWSQKIQNAKNISNGGLKYENEEIIPNLSSEFKSDNIRPPFLAKKLSRTG